MGAAFIAADASSCRHKVIMSTFSANLFVRTDPEVLFTTLHHPEELRVWMPSLLDTRYEDLPLTVGSGFIQEFEHKDKVAILSGVVVGCEPGRLLELRYYHEFFVANVTYSLEGRGQGTELDCRIQIDYRTPRARLLGHLYQWSLNKRFHDYLGRLRGYLEAERHAA